MRSGRARSEHSVRLLELSSEFLCALRSDGTMAMRNKALERFLGYPPEELASLSLFDLFDPDDRKRVIGAGGLSGKGPVTFEGRVRCADGVHRVVAWRFLPAPESGAMYALGRDVADEGSEAALTAEIEQLHIDIGTLGEMRNNLDMCMTMEEARRVIRRFCVEAMDGWPGEVWIFNSSRNLLERIARWGDGDEDLVEMMEPADCWGMRGGRPHSFDPTGSGLPCKHHKVTPGRSVCIPLTGSNEALGLLTTWRWSESDDEKWDIYLRRAATIAEVLAMGLTNLALRESLRSQSIRDPLTTLFNRRFMEESFDRELARAIRHESTVGLIIFDIDNFKRFNDQYGHRAGDTALIQVGAMLRGIIRAEDVACRYGGEEFAVIMPGAPLEVTIQRAEAIAEAVRELIVRESGGEGLGPLTVSLGVANFPDHGETQKDLVDAADLALFAAKRAGRDCVQVAPKGGPDAGDGRADQQDALRTDP